MKFLPGNWGGVDGWKAHAIEILDRDHLIDVCQTEMRLTRIDPAKFRVEFNAYDERIGRDTYLVSLGGFGVLGFTDGPCPDQG